MLTYQGVWVIRTDLDHLHAIVLKHYDVPSIWTATTRKGTSELAFPLVPKEPRAVALQFALAHGLVPMQTFGPEDPSNQLVEALRLAHSYLGQRDHVGSLAELYLALCEDSLRPEQHKELVRYATDILIAGVGAGQLSGPSKELALAALQLLFS